MTTHHHTPPPDPMPLDPEERALAARLARLGPHGEPSPALDARVLAAAHAATAGGARAAAGRRRGERDRGWRRARWPVGAGAAASVMLAAVIAWQMRPLPAPVLPSPESAVAASTVVSAPPQAVMEIERAADVAPPPPPPSIARDAAVPAPRALAVPLPAPEREATAAKAMAPPAESPPIVFDEPSPAEATAPLPAAPPARAQPMQQAASASAAAASGIAVDAPEADVPPATAASPEVREAWLARIRELAAAGRTDEARASLAEFHRRHPAFAIPDDLRPLLPAPAPPPR